MVFDCFGRKNKVIIAMAHIGAVPGTPLYDAGGGILKLIDGVLRDVERLQAGGVDAIMFGNENDRPYVLEAPVEGVAAMTAVVEAVAVKPALKLPFGVNYLWDPKASVAIGAITGASFVREILTGVFASDMGLWQPDCAGAARLRRTLGRSDMKLLFNINAEFAHSLDARPIELRARSAAFSSLADAILVVCSASCTRSRPCADRHESGGAQNGMDPRPRYRHDFNRRHPDPIAGPSAGHRRQSDRFSRDRLVVHGCALDSGDRAAGVHRDFPRALHCQGLTAGAVE
jgi:uncharacterized protein